jgi:hypothetical protein
MCRWISWRLDIRTMLNLKQAVQILPCVLVFDNDDIRQPFRLAAIFRNGKRTFSAGEDPEWFHFQA